jgi:integrase
VPVRHGWLIQKLGNDSEVLGMPWAAVDLEAGVLSIYQKLIKVENRAVVADETKVDHTGAAVAQVIVLAPVAATMLQAWRTAQVEERRLWPWRKDYNDLVFTKEDGLRHGWATAALRAGVHPKLVREVMRHSSYSTTADTYTHVMPAQAPRRSGPWPRCSRGAPGSSFRPPREPQRRRERLVVD